MFGYAISLIVMRVAQRRREREQEWTIGRDGGRKGAARWTRDAIVGKHLLLRQRAVPLLPPRSETFLLTIQYKKHNCRHTAVSHRRPVYLYLTYAHSSLWRQHVFGRRNGPGVRRARLRECNRTRTSICYKLILQMREGYRLQDRRTLHHHRDSGPLRGNGNLKLTRPTARARTLPAM